MTRPNRHRIQRQIVDLAIGDSAEGPALYRELAHPFWDRAEPELERVFDAVAGPYFQAAYDRLRPEGRVVVYGAADLMPPGTRVNYLRLARRYLRRPRIDPLRLIAENRSVIGFNLIWLWDRVQQLAAGRAALDALVTAPPFVGRRLAFAEAPAAMRYLQSGQSIGKVVLEW